MNQNNVDSTEMDTEYDIVDEINEFFEKIEKSLSELSKKKVSEDILYLKFLLKELDDTLTGEFENLRRKRFIVKKSP
ncbi:hypothetical protein ACFLZG_02165 [Thermodesulfobacteriota bacterium]